MMSSDCTCALVFACSNVTGGVGEAVLIEHCHSLGHQWCPHLQRNSAMAQSCYTIGFPTTASLWTVMAGMPCATFIHQSWVSMSPSREVKQLKEILPYTTDDIPGRLWSLTVEMKWAWTINTEYCGLRMRLCKLNQDDVSNSASTRAWRVGGFGFPGGVKGEDHSVSL